MTKNNANLRGCLIRPIGNSRPPIDIDYMLGSACSGPAVDAGTVVTQLAILHDEIEAMIDEGAAVFAKPSIAGWGGTLVPIAGRVPHYWICFDYRFSLEAPPIVCFDPLDRSLLEPPLSAGMSYLVPTFIDLLEKMNCGEDPVSERTTTPQYDDWR